MARGRGKDWHQAGIGSCLNETFFFIAFALFLHKISGDTKVDRTYESGAWAIQVASGGDEIISMQQVLAADISRRPQEGVACRSTVIGSVRENVDPCPTSDSTQIFPPCINDAFGDCEARSTLLAGDRIVGLLELPNNTAKVDSVDDHRMALRIREITAPCNFPQRTTTADIVGDHHAGAPTMSRPGATG